MITTCWSEDPMERWEVPVMRELFFTLGRWNAISGNGSTQIAGKPD